MSQNYKQISTPPNVFSKNVHENKAERLFYRANQQPQNTCNNIFRTVTETFSARCGNFFRTVTEFLSARDGKFYPSPYHYPLPICLQQKQPSGTTSSGGPHGGRGRPRPRQTMFDLLPTPRPSRKNTLIPHRFMLIHVKHTSLSLIIVNKTYQHIIISKKKP